MEKEKAIGFLLGLAAGEASAISLDRGHGPEVGDETAFALISARALCEASPPRRIDEEAEPGEIDAFMRAMCRGLISWSRSPFSSKRSSLAVISCCESMAGGKDWREAGIAGARGGTPVALALPLGLWFDRAYTHKLVRYGCAVATPLSKDDLVGCAAVCGGAMVGLAASGLPVGAWAAELMTIAGGIFPEISAQIEMAAERAASGSDPATTMADGVLGTGWLAHETIGCSLYCCMSRPASFEDAVKMAQWAGNVRLVSALVGACMGARGGEESIPRGMLGFDGIDEVRRAADMLGGRLE